MSLVHQINQGPNLQITQGDTGCCNETALTVCKIEIILDDPALMDDIVIDGTTYAIDWVLADGLGALALKIRAAMETAGYVPNVDDLSGVNVYNDLWIPNRVVVEIFSNAATITATGTGVDAMDPDCIKTVACRYNFEVPFDTASFDISDSEVETEDAGNSPQSVTTDAVSGDKDQLGSDIWDALVALYAGKTNVTEKRVRVVEDTPNEKFIVDVFLYGRHPIAVDLGDGAVVLDVCECIPTFTTAN